ncbi:Ig-like domain-containing protein [Marine Group I thaumarchaeote SCGC AAA799-B03]|uniref:Ig-like domain-containing protein n=1 Tax=Marine Group I thaumarchaeote SCGC AAA799-B03 TaxID=1502289 RepID=A0A087S901_9ARCH|nr:Ig-like domain-containing protein [Marine Group I thaumarchaeote SCGC AAA799-B03]
MATRRSISLHRKPKQISILAICGIALGLILSPIPGVQAVDIVLNNVDTSLSSTTSDNTIDFEIRLRDPASVTFPGGTTSETLAAASSIVRIVLEPGTSSETVALFDLHGKRLSNSLLQSGQTADTSKIISVDFGGVTSFPDIYGYGYQNFGEGAFYGQGFGYFYGSPNVFTYGNTYGTLGTGVNSYGLTANVVPIDVTSLYSILLDQPSLTSGSNTIRIDILPDANSLEFFTSDVVTFTNTVTLTASSDQEFLPSTGTVTVDKPTLLVTSTTLPTSINTGTTSSKLDFSSLTSSFDGNELRIESGSTAQSTVGGITVEVQIPDNVQITFPEGVKTFQLPTVGTGEAPEGFTAGEVISIGGSSTERFTFDKALRLKISGEAGKGAFFNGVLADGSTGAKEITTRCNGDDQDTVDAQLTAGGVEDCKIDSGSDLIIWTKHASSFGSTSSSGGGAGASSGGGGGGGSFGGGSGGGGGGGAIIRGEAAVTIYDISWNMCDDNIFTVVAGPQSEGLSVKLRTGSSGVLQANLAETQSLPGRLVFEAQLSPSENFVFVQAEGVSGRGAAIAQKSVDLSQCSGSVTVNEYTPVTTSPQQGTPLPTVESATNIIPGVDPVMTPGVVHNFITSNTEITNENTGMELTKFQTLQNNADKYAELVLGIEGQTTTTIVLMDRPGLEESNNNANLFLQISSIDSQVNSMRAGLLGGDTIEIIGGTGDATVVPVSVELEIPSADPVTVSQKSSMKVNANADKIPLPSVVEDFLNTNLELVNETTGDTLTRYAVLSSVPDVFAEKELGISDQEILTLAFTDRFGRADSNGDLNVFMQISFTDEQVNSARYLQIGGDVITAEVNGVKQVSATQTVEIPLN